MPKHNARDITNQSRSHEILAYCINSFDLLKKILRQYIGDNFGIFD